MRERVFKCVLVMLATSLACIACGRRDEAQTEPPQLKQLREALPGAKVEIQDPRQLERLGPAVVPGILPDSEVRSRRAKALAGDRAAAYELVHHFDLIGNSSESQFWTRIGAENGEYNSMMSMGFASREKQGLESCVRAVFWFSRAKALLESDPRSPDTDILIQAAEQEIAKTKKQMEGC